MSDRNDLISLILGGVIVYLFLYFTGKILGTAPANAKESAEPSAHPCGCGGSPQTTVPTSETDVSGRYIYSAPITSMN